MRLLSKRATSPGILERIPKPGAVWEPKKLLNSRGNTETQSWRQSYRQGEWGSVGFSPLTIIMYTNVQHPEGLPGSYVPAVPVQPHPPSGSASFPRSIPSYHIFFSFPAWHTTLGKKVANGTEMIDSECVSSGVPSSRYRVIHLKFVFIFIFIFCVWVSGHMYVWICATCMSGALRGQKSELDLLDMELWATVWGPEIKLRFSVGAVSILNCWDFSPAPCSFDLFIYSRQHLRGPRLVLIWLCSLDSLEILIFLSLLSRCWDYGCVHHVPPSLYV